MSKKSVPRKKPEDVKSVKVAARFTPGEYEELRAKAKASGRTMNDLVRESAFRVRAWTPAHTDAEKERTRQIAAIGNNINQIARAINEQKIINHELDLLNRLHQIEKVLLALVV